MLVQSWWFVSEHLRSINVPTFISIPSAQRVIPSYSHSFPFCPKTISNACFFGLIFYHVGARRGYGGSCGCTPIFFCEAAQWTWSADKANETASLHRLVDFQHPRHFYARHLLKVKARVHDKESKDLKRLYRCDGRIQLIQINSSQSKCLRFCRKVTFFSKCKAGRRRKHQKYALAGISQQGSAWKCSICVDPGNWIHLGVANFWHNVGIVFPQWTFF